MRDKTSALAFRTPLPPPSFLPYHRRACAARSKRAKKKKALERGFNCDRCGRPLRRTPQSLSGRNEYRKWESYHSTVLLERYLRRRPGSLPVTGKPSRSVVRYRFQAVVNASRVPYISDGDNPAFGRAIHLHVLFVFIFSLSLSSVLVVLSYPVN